MFAPTDRGARTRDRNLWFALILLVLLAAALRFLPLPHEALSGDEMFSRRMAVEPSAQTWQDVRLDLVHPPLYYFVLKATTKIWGAGAVGLRLLSLFCGLLMLPLVLGLGNRMPGARWTGLLAAACVAVGRYDLFYSQEARSYAMYTVLVLLLTLWLARLPEAGEGPGFWAVGCGLMTVLVYTHYVGGVYVALAVFAVLISRADWAIKLRTLGCGVLALFLFLPWLWTEVSVLKAKHGVGENLDWQGHPTFYDLRQVWATSVGVNSFPGATLLALVLLLALSMAALVLVTRRGTADRRPVVLALACMGWLAPLLVYILSEPPINLPLFGLRHVLPSTVLLTVLCCYGLELFSERAGARGGLILAGGAVCLVLLAAGPTVQLLRAGAARYPYDRVEALVVTREHQGAVAYAAWFYGEGEPVNFYCGSTCVLPLPTSDDVLPPHVLLLYRSSSKSESGMYKRLLQDGFVEGKHDYFTDGLRTQYGTTVADLERAPR